MALGCPAKALVTKSASEPPSGPLRDPLGTPPGPLGTPPGDILGALRVPKCTKKDALGTILGRLDGLGRIPGGLEFSPEVFRGGGNGRLCLSGPNVGQNDPKMEQNGAQGATGNCPRPRRDSSSSGGDLKMPTQLPRDPSGTPSGPSGPLGTPAGGGLGLLMPAVDEPIIFLLKSNQIG